MLTPLLLSMCLSQAGDGSAIMPIPREDVWWTQRVEQIQEVVDTSGKNTDVIFVGDSITQGWEGAGEPVWNTEINQLGAINLGIGGDRTEHVLWRLENGHLNGIRPRVAVVMIGTNNFGARQDSIDEVYEGVVAIVEKLIGTVSGVHVILLDIFPRGESFNEMRGEILQVNQALQATYDDVKNVTFFPIGHHFLMNDGSISKEIMPDQLHLSREGYQLWADALVPTVSLFLGKSAGATPPPVRQPGSMQHHKPKPNQPGPWDHDVDVYQIDPKGSKTKLATFERAGVPTIGTMKDGRLIAAHQWFPESDEENFDKIAVLFSSDNGKSWTPPRAMEFDGLNAKARYPFDPTITVLDDGRVRLYFTYMVGSRIFEEATPGISSAISEDGIHFVKEEGMRLEIEDMPVIDCAVCKFKNKWHLISPFQENNKPKAYHATSKDGVAFKRIRDISLTQSFKWLGCMVNEENKLVFYGSRHHGGPPSGPGIPAMASSNGSRWKESNSILVDGADPGVVVLEDGTKIVVVTGRAREGTPSHEQMQNRKPKR